MCARCAAGVRQVCARCAGGVRQGARGVRQVWGRCAAGVPEVCARCAAGFRAGLGHVPGSEQRIVITARLVLRLPSTSFASMIANV